MAKRSVRLFAKMDVEALRTDTRLVAVGPAGFMVFWRGVAYSKEILSDGFVPKDFLSFVTVGLTDRDARGAIRALLGSGLWRAVEGGYATAEGWWEENQTTAEQVETKRKGNLTRQEAYRQRQADRKANAEPPKDPQSNALQTDNGTRDQRVLNAEQTPYSRVTEHRAT